MPPFLIRMLEKYYRNHEQRIHRPESDNGPNQKALDERLQRFHVQKTKSMFQIFDLWLEFGENYQTPNDILSFAAENFDRPQDIGSLVAPSTAPAPP